MKTQRKIVVYLVTLNLIVSSLLSPISTAYASETDSSSVASNDVSTPAPISESVVDSGNAASCVNGDDRADSVSFPSVDTEFESNIQYVYIAQPFLLVGQTQEVAFATLDESDVLKSSSISLVNESGEIQTIEASALSGNSAGFSFGPDLPVDSYSLSRISYCLNDSSDPVFIDLSSNSFSFTVTDETASSDSSDMSVYYADQNGNTVQASSIEDALALSDDDSGIEAFSADSRSARKNVRVIALDAGHGGIDPGAQGNGKSEADLTWKIVSACKAKLEGYGFKVILAREQSGSYGSNDYLYRVQRCVSQGAQAYISFHINSGSSAAHGAEVYSPTVNGSDFTQVSYELAQKVQSNLVALGLSNRGVFQMQLGDEFAVIRCAREAGIPGILIEHGFISNWGDTNNYFSDAGCKRLGEADADAIIAQFPKSSWLDYSAVFDADYYLSNNPDVNRWANGSKEKALEHFIDYGMSEGRRGSASFDVQSYRCRYSDLRRSFGTNLSLYYLHFIDFGKKEGRDGSPTDLSLYSIMGTPFVSDSDLAGYYKKKVGESTYPAAVYSSFGAPSIDEFCSIVFEEACAEGVHPEVVFCQSMIETGWLRFGGSVKAEQCNFAGIGAVSTSASGTSFPDVRTGVRAQVQHLKAYASLSPLNKACVDPRFNLVERGCAPLLTDLDGRWAVPGDGYGNRIYRLVSELISLNY